MKKTIIWASLTILILLCAWAPWITESYSVNKVQEQFNNQEEIPENPCGFNCNDCGIKFEGRTFFGTQASASYACGMMVQNQGPQFVKLYFISFIGTTHEFRIQAINYA